MKGQGRVYQLPGRKSWMLDYYAPAPGDRVVRVRESAGTEDRKKALSMLRDKVAHARVAKKAGESVELPAARRKTVGQYLDDYLRNLAHREKKGAKDETYRLGPESPLRQALGHYRASAIDRDVLEKYAEKRREAGRANATINRDLQGLRSAFRLGKLKPMPDFPEKMKERVRTGFFDVAELDRLCAVSPPWLAEMERFAFSVGWRLGELRGLRWEWVDWTEREVRLPDSKNDEGRVIPIRGELLPLMERLRAQRTIARKDGSTAVSEFVFHVDGRPISKKRYRRAWSKARIAARLEGRIFHDFRRTGARRLINAGVSQAVAMKVTGHKTPSIFRRYQIVEKDDVSLALEKVASRQDETRNAELISLNGHRNGHR